MYVLGAYHSNNTTVGRTMAKQLKLWRGSLRHGATICCDVSAVHTSQAVQCVSTLQKVWIASITFR